MPRVKTGMAGEFWFFSQLHRLGYEAFITLGNTKGVDIAVKLNNGQTLTFEVKSKINFGGSFQYLDNIEKKHNHFAVFVNLNATKNKNNKTFISGEPICYIIESIHLNDLAFHWRAKTGAEGYGFEAKLLWYLKHKDTKSITERNITDFIKRHKLKEKINFQYYNKIIWTLEDFENKHYKYKEHV
jgi:hypothetical protein